MHGALRTGRASSVDFRFQGIDHLQSATSPRSPTQVSMFEKLARRNKSITRDDFVGSNKEAAAGFSSVASPKYEKGAFVWRDRDEVKTGRWRTRKTLLYGGLLLTLVIVAWTQDILNTPASQIFRRRRLSSSKASLLSSRATCNPYARQGKFEVDYAEPSNNVWLPAPSSGSGKKRSIASGDCAAAPQYMAHLRNADFAGLEWMRNRTVLLIGDSIERDHVSLFCSLLGREPEVVKGHHKLAPGGSAGSKDILQSPRQAEIKKKDRGARIAFKGMQESTLPRTCYIEELNFMIANLYHFGLDEQEYWAGLDQYHGPGPIEARFEQQVAPFLNKLSQAGRSVDLVEIGSGHYDLARWAREDVENKASTEEPLSAERLSWYKQRVSAFVALAEKYFPQSTRTYRPPTPPEEQSAELDYFNDRFGHSPSTVTPYFAPLRVYQLDAEIRSLLQPLEPSARLAPVDSSRALRKIKRDAPPAGSDSISSAEELVSGTFYNTWAQLVKGAPAHQLDRLHGGDLAAPGAVLWSDMMLWHLRQGTQDDL